MCIIQSDHSSSQASPPRSGVGNSSDNRGRGDRYADVPKASRVPGPPGLASPEYSKPPEGDRLGDSNDSPKAASPSSSSVWTMSLSGAESSDACADPLPSPGRGGMGPPPSTRQGGSGRGRVTRSVAGHRWRFPRHSSAFVKTRGRSGRLRRKAEQARLRWGDVITAAIPADSHGTTGPNTLIAAASPSSSVRPAPKQGGHDNIQVSWRWTRQN